mmetsp:Transcript_1208/g.4772  ORF Transcript_1208/g.4772 Transcript_1208/m.4772 type:complete len:226 (-) Transcript_1208:448-1125(-)
MGMPARYVLSSTSSVCGITPSSAATTTMATSVTCAPRSRIALKAAWPGVSSTVMDLDECGMSTTNAPTCCVMPPASAAATLLERSASSRVVLPWSTCPITATTGGREGSSAPLPVPSRSASVRSPRRSGRVTSTPHSVATSSATSIEMTSELPASMSRASSTRRMRRAGTPKRDASSRSVALSGSVMGPLGFFGAAWAGWRPPPAALGGPRDAPNKSRCSACACP